LSVEVEALEFRCPCPSEPNVFVALVDAFDAVMMGSAREMMERGG